MGHAPKRVRLGVSLAACGWLVAIPKAFAFSAYIKGVEICLAVAGPGECGSSAAIVAAMACLVAGPAFLGIAAATNRTWAWLATAVLAAPAVFAGYDFLAFVHLWHRHHKPMVLGFGW